MKIHKTRRRSQLRIETGLAWGPLFLYSHCFNSNFEKFINTKMALSQPFLSTILSSTSSAYCFSFFRFISMCARFTWIFTQASQWTARNVIWNWIIHIDKLYAYSRRFLLTIHKRGAPKLQKGRTNHAATVQWVRAEARREEKRWND